MKNDISCCGHVWDHYAATRADKISPNPEQYLSGGGATMMGVSCFLCFCGQGSEYEPDRTPYPSLMTLSPNPKPHTFRYITSIATNILVILACQLVFENNFSLPKSTQMPTTCRQNTRITRPHQCCSRSANPGTLENPGIPVTPRPRPTLRRPAVRKRPKKFLGTLLFLPEIASLWFLPSPLPFPWIRDTPTRSGCSRAIQARNYTKLLDTIGSGPIWRTSAGRGGTVATTTYVI